MADKKDWRLFRERLPKWQEDHMAKLNEEYIGILSRKDRNASEISRNCMKGSEKTKGGREC